MRNSGIGMVLHWRPPDVYIFDTDPSPMETKTFVLGYYCDVKVI